VPRMFLRRRARGGFDEYPFPRWLEGDFPRLGGSMHRPIEFSRVADVLVRVCGRSLNSVLSAETPQNPR